MARKGSFIPLRSHRCLEMAAGNRKMLEMSNRKGVEIAARRVPFQLLCYRQDFCSASPCSVRSMHGFALVCLCTFVSIYSCLFSARHLIGRPFFLPLRVVSAAWLFGGFELPTSTLQCDFLNEVYGISLWFRLLRFAPRLGNAVCDHCLSNVVTWTQLTRHKQLTNITNFSQPNKANTEMSGADSVTLP